MHCVGNTCDPNNQPATLITPVAGDTVVLDFLLDQGRKISGTVTAETGGAMLEDIKICLGHKIFTDAKECDITDASGFYEVGGLVFIDDFVVYTEDVGGQAFFAEMHDNLPCCEVANGTSVDVTSGDAVVNFALETSGLIGGFVSDTVSDLGIGNIPMELYDGNCELVETLPFVTDDNDFLGLYRISGVPDGTYYVFARGADQGYINERYPDQRMYNICDDDISNGQAVVIEDKDQVLDIDFELDPGASISGFISDINGVLAQGAGEIRLHDVVTNRQLTGIQNLEPDGSYKLMGVIPRTYHINFRSSDLGLMDERYDDIKCPRNSCSSVLGQQVLIEPIEELTDIDAFLEPGAVIRGRITDISTGQGVPGGYCVAFYASNGNYAGFACSGEDGFYQSATGFPDGEYFASNQFRVNEYVPVVGGFQPQVWIDDGPFGECGDPCDFIQGDTFTVTGVSPVEGIDLVMSKGSAFSGNVQFGGSPLEAASVLLLSNIGEELRSVQTDASGNYAFPGVIPGDYYVRTMNIFGYENRLHAIPTDVACNPDCNPFSGTVIASDGSTDVTGIA